MSVERLEKSLRQLCKGESSEWKARSAAIATLRITEHCGNFSKSRQMAYRIGKSLLEAGKPKIRVPVCLDYSNLDGGIPAIAVQHIGFLLRCFWDQVSEVEFLMPDQEAGDENLQRALKKTEREFLELVYASEEMLKKRLQPYGWTVARMTVALPELTEKEAEFREELRNDASVRMRLLSDTMSRNRLYDRTMRALSPNERIERTIRTSAQYLALGTVCAEAGYLICNHTTTNLSWFGKTGVGVLHNPVTLYDE